MDRPSIIHPCEEQTGGIVRPFVDTPRCRGSRCSSSCSSQNCCITCITHRSWSACFLVLSVSDLQQSQAIPMQTRTGGKPLIPSQASITTTTRLPRRHCGRYARQAPLVCRSCIYDRWVGSPQESAPAWCRCERLQGTGEHNSTTGGQTCGSHHTCARHSRDNASGRQARPIGGYGCQYDFIGRQQHN